MANNLFTIAIQVFLYWHTHSLPFLHSVPWALKFLITITTLKSHPLKIQQLPLNLPSSHYTAKSQELSYTAVSSLWNRSFGKFPSMCSCNKREHKPCYDRKLKQQSYFVSFWSLLHTHTVIITVISFILIASSPNS